MDASTYSQFDLLAMYLGEEQNLPAAVATKPSAMVNILGSSTGSDYKLRLPKISEPVRITPKLYGKEKSSPGRKMGHVNIVDDLGKSNLLHNAQRMSKEYHI